MVCRSCADDIISMYSELYAEHGTLSQTTFFCSPECITSYYQLMDEDDIDDNEDLDEDDDQETIRKTIE